MVHNVSKTYRLDPYKHFCRVIYSFMSLAVNVSVFRDVLNAPVFKLFRINLCNVDLTQA